MAFQKNKPSFSEFKLVFALVNNPVTGIAIESFAVRIIGPKQFSYEFYRLTPLTAKDYFSEIDPLQQEAINTIGQYSDEALVKRFGKQVKNPRNFFEEIPPEYVDCHIRPFIDKKMGEVAEMLYSCNEPLYYKGEKNDRIRELPIPVLPRFTQVLFDIRKKEKETHYYLWLQIDGKEVPLKGSGGEILSNDPCLLLLNDRLFRLEPGLVGKKLKPFLEKEYLTIPRSAESSYYHRFVLNTLKKFPVKADGFQVHTTESQPKPVLRLEKNFFGFWCLQLLMEYNGERFPYYDETTTRVKMQEAGETYRFIKTRRDLSKEKDITEKLKESGLVNRNAEGFFLPETIPSKDQPPEDTFLESALLTYISWLSGQKKKLGKAGFRIEQNCDTREFFLGSPVVELSVEEKTDWFDIYGNVRFGEHVIPFLKLRSYILKGKRAFPLPDGTLGIIPLPWFEKYHDVFKFSSGKDDVISLKKHHFPLLDQMPAKGLKIPEFSRYSDKKSPFEVPPSLQAELRPYQKKGFQWLSFLHQNNLGGCLADDMGLGKTVQALALLSSVHQPESKSELLTTSAAANGAAFRSTPLNGGGQLELFAQPPDFKGKQGGKTSLLVMPLSLIHNWLNEVRKFSPGLRVMQHTGPGRATSTDAFQGFDLVLTTYGTVRNDVKIFQDYPFYYIILDESQVIKNASSKIHQAIKKLKGSYRLVLTGTPIENSLMDLWSQLSFVNPGMLGSLNFFKEEFALPVERGNDPVKHQKLKQLIKPFILRRTKQEVATDLPPLTVTTRFCEMTEAHRDFYESKKSQIRNMIMEQVEKDGVDKSRFFVLSSLMKLRLAASHPALVDEAYKQDSGKFKEVVRSIEKLMEEGHKVLIFSQFVKHLNLYKQYFEDHDQPFSLLTGKVSEKERKTVIADFQENPQKRLFLISLRAGGVGLNLTGADYVFILDPWWNPAVENQAVNRAHRIGQDKKVFVYKFITLQSIEEKIRKLQERKSALAGKFIHAGHPIKDIQPEELRDLMK